jgi:hypothetical protein
MKHEPRRFLGYANIPMQLKGTDSLFVRREKVNSDEPLLKRYFAVFKNASDLCSELLSAIRAFVMNAIREGENLLASAMRAIDTVLPTHGYQVPKSGVFIGEGFVKVSEIIEFCHW